eukprot:SM000082S22820  [mRNA]  locus=s82:110800:111418:- [translate_table: standard]
MRALRLELARRLAARLRGAGAARQGQSEAAAALAAARRVHQRQRAWLRAESVAAERSALRAAKEEQRAMGEAWRQEREQWLARRRGRRLAELHAQSATWIEPQDLERRILEAMADPHRV